MSAIPTDDDLRIAAELFGFDGAGNRTKPPSREAIARALAEREAAVTEPLRAVLQEKDRIADLRTKGIRDRDATIAELTRERDGWSGLCGDLTRDAYAVEHILARIEAGVVSIEQVTDLVEQYRAGKLPKQPHQPTDGTDGTTQFEEPGP